MTAMPDPSGLPWYADVRGRLMIGAILFVFAFKLPNIWSWVVFYMLFDWGLFRHWGRNLKVNGLATLRVIALLAALTPTLLVHEVERYLDAERCRQSDHCTVIEFTEFP